MESIDDWPFVLKLLLGVAAWLFGLALYDLRWHNVYGKSKWGG